jgi:glycosyltransferase involved in cell wall biosynthesis
VRTEDEPPAAPRVFSIVTAVHDVGRYLDDFFASLEAQTYGMHNLDVILVDDESTDDSLAKCRAFAAKWPESVRAIGQAHGGQGSARNNGLAYASGEWVTFTDPDDTLETTYFDEIDAFLTNQDDAQGQLISTSIIMHLEATGEKVDRHPLATKFRFGNRTWDLSVDTDYIQMSAAAAVFRLDVIRDNRLRFDVRIRPTFEDCHFVAQYLLALERPLLGTVATAHYYYRKRTDASSTIETSGGNPDKYTLVPKLGHLALLREARHEGGRVPVWLQNMVVYDLSWYLKADAAVPSSTGGLPPAVTNAFHRLVSEVLSLIDPETIALFAVMPISDDIRFALLHGFTSERFVSTEVTFSDVDIPQRLIQLTYRFTGPMPVERILVDGQPTEPAHSKLRSIEYYHRTVGIERIVWVPAGLRVHIEVDGHRMPITRPGDVPRDVIEDTGVLKWDVPRKDGRPGWLSAPKDGLITHLRKRAGRSVASGVRPALFELMLALALHSPPVRRRYGDAWVFMDRDIDAGDSAEYLYRYVAAHHGEVNSWFVLKRSSRDWNRLRRDGVRLVPYGSWRWQLLMLAAAHVASSHADLYVIRPLERRRFGLPQWRFTFLQHGVIKDDLSRWLNQKRFDLFVTSSPREYESIVGDNTPYAFTTKEVKLTGLPRHDALIAKRDATRPEARTLLLIMPTWRFNLVGDSLTSATDRVTRSGFSESEYAKQFTLLLHSAELGRLSKEADLEIVFMPHPNMRPYLGQFSAPDYVRVASYDDADVQELLARGRLLVTDYSSMAFNAAAIELPTIYFQFDQEEFFSGVHPGRHGYFDYERDGFGPVSTTIRGVEKCIRDMLANPAMDARYAQRRATTYAYHDLKNSQRVFEAMRSLTAQSPSERVSAPEVSGPGLHATDENRASIANP